MILERTKKNIQIKFLQTASINLGVQRHVYYALSGDSNTVVTLNIT